HWELGIGPPATVAVWAAEPDYELVELGDCRGRRGDERADSCVLILRERWRRSTAGWGTLLLRRGPDTLPATIEVPRPHREFETWRIGAELWQLSKASALLIAGADALPRDPRAELVNRVIGDDPRF